MEKAGVNKEQLRNARETDQNVVENLINKIKRNEKKEKQRKINKSRYNNIYKDVMTEDAPKYLNVRNSKDRSLIARYKCRKNAEMRQKGASTGGKKSEDAESARQRKKACFTYLMSVKHQKMD